MNAFETAKLEGLERRIEMLEVLVKTIQIPATTVPFYPVYVPQQPILPNQPYWVTACHNSAEVK